MYSEPILVCLIDDAAIAHLASAYLVILIGAIPGYTLFETGKRFLQSQGLFGATTYILLIAVPFHIAVLWLLVTNFGFIGAPIAIVITRTFIPILLLLYVRFIDGSQGWGGFSKRAFANWRPMIHLAVPGRFGADYLAAQSILAAVGTVSFQVPFSMSIAASTRVASLIGAGLVDAGRVAAKVAVAAICITGCLNLAVYLLFRSQLPSIFTDDEAVMALTTQLLPLLAVSTFIEGLGATAHGVLRGIGRQSIGGPAVIFSYYFVGIPVALALAFGLDWKLKGLIVGLAAGLLAISLIEYTYLCMTDWRGTVMEAAARNAAG